MITRRLRSHRPIRQQGHINYTRPFAQLTTPSAAALLGIRIGSYEYRVQYDAREIRIKQEPCADEEAFISGDVTSLRRVLLGHDTLTEAVRSGRIDARGDESVLLQFTTLFPIPTL